jgi:hypothetical protein
LQLVAFTHRLPELQRPGAPTMKLSGVDYQLAAHENATKTPTTFLLMR